MGLKSYLSGIKGENKACEFLKNNNFEIIERNFRSKFGEIDIVAKKDKILHFIEVKYGEKNYELAYRLDYKKYCKILKTIDFYILKRKLVTDFQVDLICINKDDIEFLENISF